MTYYQIPKKIAQVSNKTAYLYFTLCWMKGHHRHISRAYLAKALGITSKLDQVTEYLRRLESIGLIKIGHYRLGLNLHLAVSILPCRDYYLVSSDFLKVSEDSAYKGFLLRLRCFCWDDSLKIALEREQLAEALDMCKPTLRKYLKDYKLAHSEYFFKQKNKWQKATERFAKYKQTIINKIKACMTSPHLVRRAKWALDHFTGFNVHIYDWLISGLRWKTPKPQEELNIKFAF